MNLPQVKNIWNHHIAYECYPFMIPIETTPPYQWNETTTPPVSPPSKRRLHPPSYEHPSCAAAAANGFLPCNAAMLPRGPQGPNPGSFTGLEQWSSWVRSFEILKCSIKLLKYWKVLFHEIQLTQKTNRQLELEISPCKNHQERDDIDIIYERPS